MNNVKVAGNGHLVIDDVILPFVVDDEIITPDFEELLDYWPFYKMYGGTAGPREYLLLAVKELELRKIRGRSSDDWLRRIMSHFGMERVTRFFTQGAG